MDFCYRLESSCESTHFPPKDYFRKYTYLVFRRKFHQKMVPLLCHYDKHETTAGELSLVLAGQGIT